MLTSVVNTVFTATLALSALGAAAPHRRDNGSTTGLSLTAQLQLADTAVDRYRLLPGDEDFVFDFKKSQSFFANRQTFPALTGLGGSMAVAEIPACSMSFLHTHPRASELFAVVSGRILTEMVTEAGVVGPDGKPRVIRADLGPSQMTVFPQGAFHTQVNPECSPASVAVSFTSEEAGVGLIASQTFALSDDVIARSFGNSIAGEDIDKVRNAIPKGVAIKVDECLKKCGIQKRAA
ncbi:Spherulin-1A [Colletotrichum shisoi]|uniref:Spherulin-1A n=1 Tax=Colletotrichum shisoi TaxID=2078593 RepID=A0A5Q4BLN0_9PEZI|nr:Spherulin-1A [Colletotrichum shisoi]